MTSNSTRALGLGVIAGAVLALPALAHGDLARQGSNGPGEGHAHMMQRGGSVPDGMPGGGKMHPMMGMHGHAGGPDMMGGMGMPMSGPMGGGAMMGAMHEAFDANRDGRVAPDELRAGLEEKLAEYDADGDGALSLEEFETLHTDMMRELMVDRFQHLDNDGDGNVTSEEMMRPADRMQRMWQRHERMREAWPVRPRGRGPGDGSGRVGPAENRGSGMMGPRDGSMMQED